MDELITYEDFEKVNVRVGVIVEVEDFPRARKPSYRVTVDFGPEIGKSSPVLSLQTTHG
jgi:tRNA-binding protein